MAINPKLEFYRFTLTPKKKGFKTFKDFAKEELNKNKDLTDAKAIKLCFEHFIKSLDGDNAKDEKLKKRIFLEKKRSINKYLDKQPAYKSEDNIIYGVINGGPYGRDRIMSDNDNPEDSAIVGQNKTISLYFYFLVYLPTDHNEGCFIIHSNAKDESITNVFRSYIVKIFKSVNYNQAICEVYCPKSFQKEYRNGAVIKSMNFKDSFIDTIHTTDGISNSISSYDVKIQIIPKDKNISMNDVESVFSSWSKKIFGNQDNSRTLENFNRTTIETENSVDKNSHKTFELSTKDNEFIPVIYLDDRIKEKNADGTPNFDELNVLCFKYFKDEILPEIRPDLNVTEA